MRGKISLEVKDVCGMNGEAFVDASMLEMGLICVIFDKDTKYFESFIKGNMGNGKIIFTFSNETMKITIPECTITSHIKGENFISMIASFNTTN